MYVRDPRFVAVDGPTALIAQSIGQFRVEYGVRYRKRLNLRGLDALVDCLRGLDMALTDVLSEMLFNTL